MNLVQTGNIVTGTYAGGEGTINGVVTGNRLTGTWVRGGSNGPFDFWVDGSGDNWQGNFNESAAWCGRRSGEAYPTPCGVASWYGTWSTDCGLLASCGNLTIAQDGSTVTGSYAGGQGTITGTVNGATLTGTYMRGIGNGTISFQMLGDGNQFNGNWGGTNHWCGSRNGAVNPIPCLN